MGRGGIALELNTATASRNSRRRSRRMARVADIA
jgi:hypothetical protein